jgi:hypothetical protein
MARSGAEIEPDVWRESVLERDQRTRMAHRVGDGRRALRVGVDRSEYALRRLAACLLALALPACPDPRCANGGCTTPIGLVCDVGDDSQCPRTNTCAPLGGGESLGTCVRVKCDGPQACASGTTCWPPDLESAQCEEPVTCGSDGVACSEGECADGMTCGQVFVMQDGVPEPVCACVP